MLFALWAEHYADARQANNGEDPIEDEEFDVDAILAELERNAQGDDWEDVEHIDLTQ